MSDWSASSGASTASSQVKPLLPQGLLLILLVESLLDAIFIGAAGAPGVKSSHVGSVGKITKQSGHTVTAALEGASSGTQGHHTIPRQHDAIKNMGLKLKFPALKHDSAGTEITAVWADDGLQAGSQLTDTQVIHNEVTTTNNAGAHIQSHVHAGRPILNSKLAYAQYAQWLIISSVSFTVSQQAVTSMSGEDLLIIHDIFGVGQKGLSVVANTHFSAKDIATRVAASSFDSTHVISCGLWFENGPTSLLPSSYPYSDCSIQVTFKTYGSLVEATSSGTKMNTALYNASPMAYNASCIYDQYVITAPEKDIVSKMAGQVPYYTIKSGSHQSSVKTADQTVRFQLDNVNFLGSMVMMYAVDPSRTDFATGKFGSGGTAVPNLKSFQLIMNGNGGQVADSVTTLWNHTQAGVLPVTGVLSISPAPGTTYKLSAPSGTIPFSRLDTVTAECVTGGATDSSSSGFLFKYIAVCWSTLQQGNGTLTPSFSQ